MTLYQINEKLKEISLRHPFVQEYAEGDIYEYLNSGEHKYGLSFLTVDKVEVNDDFQTLQASLFYVDRLTNDQSNRLQIQNTGISTLSTILNELIEEVPSISVEMETYTVFTAQFADLCAGVYATISIRYENSDGLCEDVLEEKEGLYQPGLKFGFSYISGIDKPLYDYIQTQEDLERMFHNASIVGPLELSLPRAKNMSYCFYGTHRIDTIKFNNLSQVTTLYRGFMDSGTKEAAFPEMPVLTNLSDCFRRCILLERVDFPDALPEVTTMQGCFNDCSALTSLTIPDAPKLKDMTGCFAGCSSLQYLSLPNLSNVRSFYGVFMTVGGTKLTDLYVSQLPNIDLTNAYFFHLTRLTHDSLMNIINALPKNTYSTAKKIQLGPTNLAKLTDEDIAIATKKYWTLL